MSDETKKHIINALKTVKSFPSSLGAVNVTGPILGQGGNGLVYPVQFSGNVDAVAKFLTDVITEKPTTQQVRFLDEYRRLVAVPPHPNLIRLYHFDHVTFDGLTVPVIIMEKGVETLSSKIKREGKLSAEQLETMTKQLCSVLDHIHQSGIVHRDVKPENILIRADGSFVLADFGIAWFDPELHQHEKLTKRGDRMANFMFSAPEQLDSLTMPTSAADIYALGQTIYWSVLQQVVRGTNYVPLSQTSSDYAKFDPVLHEMLQQEAGSRLQSGEAVIAGLYRMKEAQRKAQENSQWEQHVLKCIAEFELRVRRIMPGQEGIVHVQDRLLIDRLMSSISDGCDEWELWWTRGGGNLPIDKIEQLETGGWLIGNIETQITDLWVGRNHTLDQCFILMRSDPMASFGIYEPRDRETEEVGLYKGTYVTLAEYSDGYAIIGGESVEISGEAKRRFRNLKPYYIFLATKYNPILVSQRRSNADALIEKVVDDIEKNDHVEIKWLEPLMQLPKHEVSQLHS